MKKQRFLSDLIDTLPRNCLFDKGKIGCGGTSLAIESNEAFVICVPFISLVENKLAQYPNKRRTEPILGVTGETKVSEIKDYLNEVEIPKIITTYDSLGKVTNQINSKQFRILVDEYHLLFNQYSFRRDAVQVVLDNYLKYKDFCFMTATPIEKDFLLDELKEIPVVTQSWKDVLTTKVQAIKCKNIKASTIKLINCFLDGKIEGNAYLFVNSVEFIKTIIENTNLNTDNCRVIYSKNNKTSMPLENSTTTSKPKKINFLTSTVFEGSDIYDPNGRIIIISDPSKCQTLLDISTSVQQIAGRIRNSKYINSITHLYGQTRYSDLSYEEFRESAIKTEEETKQLIDDINTSKESVRKFIYNKTDISDKYIKKLKSDYKFEFDPNLVKVDLYNFKICSGTYSVRVNIGDTYERAGFDVVSATDNSIKVDLNSTKETFADLVKSVREELSQTNRTTNPVYDKAVSKYPFLKDAIDLLGFEKIATLKYNQTKIKNELLKRSRKDDYNKILAKIENRIKVGFWYTKADLKKIFQSAYDALDLNRTGKATDVLGYFEVKPSSRTAGNGFTILSKKLIK